MPILIPCACGKTFKVKDELAGKRVKCPGCAALMTVPAANANVSYAVEPVAPAAPAAAPDPPRADTAGRKKKKRKRPARLTPREADDAEYDRWRERVYWRQRIFRGSAFVVLGLVIIGGAAYMLANHSEDIEPYYSVLLIVAGAAAVLKGLAGLFLGQFFGED